MNAIQAEQEHITQATFSKRVGVSASAVSQAVAAGRFSDASMTPNGFLIYPRCLQDWIENADSRRFGPGRTNTLNSVSYDTQKPATEEAPEELSPPAQPGGMSPDHYAAREGTLAWEKIETAKIKRRQLEMEIAEREGRLIPIDRLEGAGFEMGRLMRKILKALPALADDLARSPEPEKMRALLRVKAGEIAAEMAKEFGALAARAVSGEEIGHDESADDGDE